MKIFLAKFQPIESNNTYSINTYHQNETNNSNSVEEMNQFSTKEQQEFYDKIIKIQTMMDESMKEKEEKMKEIEIQKNKEIKQKTIEIEE